MIRKEEFNMPDRNMFLAQIDARKGELFELLQKLIRFDSQNLGSSGREAGIAAFIRDELTAMGLSADLYSPDSIDGLPDHVDYWPGHNLADRPNVTGTLSGTAHTRRLMLAAHSDTTPIGDPRNWTVDPFGGILKDGKIWGRGACDDKYGIAAALFLLRLLHDEGIKLPYDLLFTAYCDEEFGGGNGALAASVKYPCDDILNLDCKNFEIWACAVGGGVIRAKIRSNEPLDSAGKMLDGLTLVRAEFDAFRERRRDELRKLPYYRDTIIPDTTVRFMELRAGDNGSDLNRAFADVTYYTALTEPEINREFDAMAVRLNEALAPLGMCFDGFEKVTRFFHHAATADENPALDLLCKVSLETSGRKLTPCGSCLSDLPLFILYGSPRAFSFGIGRDFSVYGGAHQADEFIECDALVEFTKIIGAFLLSY